MILNNTPKNEAIISNVGQIGEFRIRNSAKAFSILSSGLYSNKIRAIIRELSCNAVDSHVAAGKETVPFDVHLPTTLEPWFAIRDYGVGLNHDQVTNIYTTYFESTKTESNDFIGALGLGSKSPFSYTDNFTVTAIKDGRKGIYTAFIDDKGVPSIALMAEEQTTEPTGVEIRMGVEDRNDFWSFSNEASDVYTYFKLRPVVTGPSGFKFAEPQIKERDIVPGVHYMAGDGHYSRPSYAIMGNIEYPINIPDRSNLNEVFSLLECGLILEFGIGELDFNASRETLSYIPLTVDSIQKKLELLNNRLAIHIAEKANVIKNKWERAYFLQEQYREPLWKNAVKKYIADTKFSLIKMDGHYANGMKFSIEEKTLAEDFNIKLRGFYYQHYQSTARNRTVSDLYNQQTGGYVRAWEIQVGARSKFVINDTTSGSLERAKFHWRETANIKTDHDVVYVIDAVDKDKPVKTKEFFKLLKHPPKSQISNVSELKKRERAQGMAKNISILHLEQRDDGYHQRSKDMVWRDAGNLNTFDGTKDHYYVPLSGFNSLGVVSNMKEFASALTKTGIFTGTIYGVRKSDIDEVKKLANWIEIDPYVRDKLENISEKDVLGAIKAAIDFNGFFRYYEAIKMIDARSPYIKLYNALKDYDIKHATMKSSLEFLNAAYKISGTGKIEIDKLIAKYDQEKIELIKRYPLLSEVRYTSNHTAVAEYINAIDLMKGY